MNNTYDDKEVFFDEYCETCKYRSKQEYEEPCATCLDNPVNLNSHKPTEWKEA